MATYTHREVVSTTVEYEIPCSYGYGGAVAEFFKAYAAAEQEAKGYGIDTSWDNWCTLHPGDEAIFLRFEKPTGPTTSI